MSKRDRTLMWASAGAYECCVMSDWMTCRCRWSILRWVGALWLAGLENRLFCVSTTVTLRGRRRQLFENLSTMTRIHVLPSEGGRSVMKSTPRCDQGRFGTGSGRSLPDGRWRGFFEMAQSGHPCTNLRTSRAIFVHHGPNKINLSLHDKSSKDLILTAPLILIAVWIFSVLVSWTFNGGTETFQFTKCLSLFRLTSVKQHQGERMTDVLFRWTMHCKIGAFRNQDLF